ncbi:MAG: hypothetical protein U1C74_19135 [Phenylobacterium sp.]|nr:hypothetical protein [Phenylobacterium sp.]
MIRIFFSVLVFAAGSSAAAGESAAPARATIVDPMMLRLAWPTAMPNVSEATGGLDGARFTGEIPSMGMANAMPANARLVIRRIDDTGATVTAPVGFQVVTGGPRQGLVIRTGTADLAARRTDRLIVGGALAGGTAASIGVGQGPDLAVARSTLAVVVQYN